MIMMGSIAKSEACIASGDGTVDIKAVPTMAERKGGTGLTLEICWFR